MKVISLTNKFGDPETIQLKYGICLLIINLSSGQCYNQVLLYA